MADSERCALAQAGPFNSHTLAEQALNQPGREVNGSRSLLSKLLWSLLPSGGLGSHLVALTAIWWPCQLSGTFQCSLRHTACLHGFKLLHVTESASSAQQLDGFHRALTCRPVLH